MIPWQLILGIIGPIVEKIIPNTAQAAALKAEISAQLLGNAHTLEQSQAQIITAEARSDGWLTRTWRPLAMLNFLLLLDLYWLGMAPAYLVANPNVVQQLFSLLTVGIGGYVGGRSLEKIVPQIAGMMGAKSPAPIPQINYVSGWTNPASLAPAVSPAPPPEPSDATAYHRLNGN